MLLLFNKPFKDESLCSYVYRIAKDNLMENLDWILNNFQLEFGYKINDTDLNWAEVKLLKDICKVTGIELQFLEKMTYKYYLDYFSLPYHNKIKCPWFLYAKTKVCIQCLEEKGFHKLHWNFTSSFLCLEHNLLLTDRCNFCKRKLTIKSAIHNKCICSEPITKSPKIINKNTDLFDLQEIIQRFFSQSNSVIFENITLSHSVFFRTIQFLSTWIPQLVLPEEIKKGLIQKNIDEIIARTRLKTSRDVLLSLPLYLKGYSILNNWPLRFHYFLSSLDKSSKEKLKLFCNIALPKLKNTDLDFIYREFINFLANPFSTSSINGYVMLEEAIELTHLSSEDIYKEKSLFKILNCDFNGMMFTLVDKVAIDNWLHLYGSNLSKQDIVNFWGTSQKATYSILSNNIIRGAIMSKIGSYHNWKIPSSTFNEFMTKIKENSIDFFSEENITFNKAVVWAGVNNAYLILKLMIEGAIIFSIEDENIGECKLHKKQLYIVLSNLLYNHSKREEKVKLKDLIFIFGVKRSDLIHWINTHRFGNEFYNINKLNDFICFDAFVTFYNTYYTTYQLSIEMNITVKQVLKKHSLGHYKSVSGPQLNDGKRLLFLKSDFK